MPAFPRLVDRPYLLLTLTSLFWAGNAVVGRAVVHLIPPVMLAQLRWTIAFLLLLPFAWPHIRDELSVVRKHLGILALLAFTGVTVFNTLLYWSLTHTTAINATLMQSAAPLLIGLWSLVLFREPLTLRQVGGVVVSLAGVLVVVSEGEPARLAGLSLNTGDIAVLVAITVYALYSTLLRRRPGISMMSLLGTTMGIGAVLIAPFTAAEAFSGARIAPLTAGALAALGYVVVFPSILAYFCFNRGVQLVGANRAGPFFHLIPLFGALLAVVFLGEQPGVYHGVGAVLIVGGVVVASRGAGSARKNRSADERAAG